MKFFKPISISLSPNVEKDDVLLALNLIIRPWLWKKGKALLELENHFKQYLGVKYAVSFNSGRSALYAILKAIEIDHSERSYAPMHRSEVFLQGFTCNAAINPVLWAKMKPVYVDCNTKDFNIDIEDLEIKIAENPKAKILMVQHTFGNSTNMDEAMSIVRQHNLTLVEDCAHALGAEWNNKKVGTFGKAGFFSFSRDKVISSVYGGMAVTNDEQLGEKLLKLQKEFSMPTLFWIKQQLLHPILLYFIILPGYKLLDLGKLFLVFSQWFHILSKAVHWKEKRGLRPKYFPKALPNAMAILALNQLTKLNKFYSHRRKLFQFYNKNLSPLGGIPSTGENTDFELPSLEDSAKSSYLRYTIKHKKAHDIIYEAWHKENILLGDWYTTAIAPYDTKLSEMQYKKGMCKNAEWLSKRTLNLPTHINISIKDAERIIKFLKKWR